MGMTVDEQMAVFRRGASEIIGEAEIREKLGAGKSLRVKLGVDPTARDVTLGWAVVLRKLRDFQRYGHTACLIVGDFTAQIGDPSGKSKTRRQLTADEVRANVDAVLQQVGKILDVNRAEILFNNDWLGKMKFDDVIRLCSRYTVARILERDDFAKRLADNRPIAMHEILYPLCQGMDSVEIDADVEIGGTDQKFNNLVGRTLMEGYGRQGQAVVLCPLLVGLDGKDKMSQSLGNYVSVIDAPNDMYGKTMSIPDELIANWFELCTDVPTDEYRALLASTSNPRDAKRRLAREIVALYHDAAAADEADQYFLSTFSRRELPTDVPEVIIPADAVHDGQVNVVAMLAGLGLAKSKSDARRLIEAGAVSIAGNKLTASQTVLTGDELDGEIVRVGKHQFVRASLRR